MNAKSTYQIAAGFVLLLVGVLFSGGAALAYEVQDYKDVPVLNDFVVGPTKHEIFLEPGQSAVTQMYIMNRLGRAMNFQLHVEDFEGSYDPEQTVVLLGDKRGPYSLKDYLKPEATEFTLSHGQKVYFEVRIEIPQDAEPGGRYGAVLVSTNPPGVSLESEAGKAAAGITVKTRIASLFFVTVKGEVKQEGALKEFKMAGRPSYGFFEKGPFGFEIYFENSGNVHLVPYGIIEFNNMMGKKVGEAEIDPYFAMPQSLRARKIVWASNQFMFGKYTAALSLNRGYDNKVDTASIDFWVIPWRQVLMIFGAIVLFVLLLRFIAGKFEIRRRQPTQPST